VSQRCQTKAEIADVVAGSQRSRHDAGDGLPHHKGRSTDSKDAQRQRRSRRRYHVTDATIKLMLGWMLNFEGMTAVMAYNTAVERGINVPVEVETFRAVPARERPHRKDPPKNITPHRRFEAKAPGEMFQFDISGLKGAVLTTSPPASIINASGDGGQQKS
jgi:hypothetical protein